MNTIWIRTICFCVVLLLGLSGLALASYSIPQESIDEQRIFYGSALNFAQPASVDYQKVVRSTPEYNEIRDKRIENGTARYWILMSEASNHAVQLISSVGKESDYDIIVANGYLEGLEEPIETVDVTELVLKKLEERQK